MRSWVARSNAQSTASVSLLLQPRPSDSDPEDELDDELEGELDDDPGHGVDVARRPRQPGDASARVRMFVLGSRSLIASRAHSTTLSTTTGGGRLLPNRFETGDCGMGTMQSCAESCVSSDIEEWDSTGGGGTYCLAMIRARSCWTISASSAMSTCALSSPSANRKWPSTTCVTKTRADQCAQSNPVRTSSPPSIMSSSIVRGTWHGCVSN